MKEEAVWKGLVQVPTQTVSKKHKNTAAQFTGQLNEHLDSTVSTRTVHWRTHRVNIYGWAAVIKLLDTCASAKHQF